MPQQQLRIIEEYQYFKALTITAEAVVRYYADIASKDAIIPHDEEVTLVQAADFLIKEARRCKKLLPNMDVGVLHSDLDAAEQKLNRLKRIRRA